ncbi:MAG TPA: type IV pilus biogenesis/stability protein PilW [Burkholderiaceae bacterium]|nr:type IV pilus biogenesis/stability protein PilW [Burkholderiaceae bacterium]
MGLPVMRSFAARRWRTLLGVFALAGVATLAGCKTTTTVTTTSDTANASGSSNEGDPHRRAAVRLQLAAGYYQKGQVEVAIKEATEATQIDPNLASAYGLLGLIYMDLGQDAQAEGNFRHALQVNPNDPELNNNFGWFLCRTHRERDSMKYFDRAASDRLYATPAMALQNAGICSMQIGQNEVAEKYLMRAFEADASSPVAKFQLARLYLQMGRFERAEFYYGLLSKTVDPNAQTLWLGTKIAHATSDRRTEQQLSQELRSRYPNSPETGLLNREAFNE